MSLIEQARWFVLGGTHQVLLDEQGQIPQGPRHQLPSSLHHATFEHFDEWDGVPCYLLDLTTDGRISQEPLTAHMAPLRQLMVTGDATGFQLAGRAWQLAIFRRTHRFCGECGAPMSPKSDEWAQTCEQGHTAYPRISPCIIVAVRRGAAILLAAHHRHYQADDPMYTVLAGFVEAGETLEQCVAREVFEESGIRVNNIRYLASQPWPFPHSLMMGFVADYESGEINVQEQELVAAAFFTADLLPRLPPHGTIARRLIEHCLHHP
ncbi:NAD(+) diphosphatase [Aeromonas cavernicola]|uniref:NAD(+) diphosphatase n=1 Tax=Aeromonas cavernicola TaxID=1006623 RepID=A0A2H9U9I0_9GAMM|nr:NAD(+) diphosphatase [Aeromonas cavernicola]PJG60686.1 NAD(+) diphosphatase [Aeromonas cavernicola]